ncbi:DUF7322 domain-containing protein [Halalkalicoccus subterraneus]|uniref:DUF7322 domain-containing protein n=1 Tax=Halalkalicoccus subterraneus TaxID=2675002 RepID=UPI000EFB385D|nr:hypothetical protein [Halalkalicoccus subterraneus]
MFPDDRSEHEPEEPDLGPEIPAIEPEESEPTLGPETPEAPDVAPEIDGMLGPEGTSTDLLSAFWTLVVLFNVGVLAASVGALFLVFEGRTYLGGGMLAVGLLALGRGIYKYWTLDFDELDTDSD